VDGGASREQQSGAGSGAIEVCQPQETRPKPDRHRHLAAADGAPRQSGEARRRPIARLAPDLGETAMDPEGAAGRHRPFQSLSREFSPLPLVSE
jgi:hypothetical protein